MWILRLRVPEDVQAIQQQLAAAQKSKGWWRREAVDQNFRQTVADIYKFVTKDAHEGWTFFNKESELAKDSKIERVRNWSNMLEIKDYMLLALADM
jgi:hypothetical protein